MPRAERHGWHGGTPGRWMRQRRRSRAGSGTASTDRGRRQCRRARSASTRGAGAHSASSPPRIGPAALPPPGRTRRRARRARDRRGVELHERRGGRAADHSHGEALHRAGGEQPAESSRRAKSASPTVAVASPAERPAGGRAGPTAARTGAATGRARARRWRRPASGRRWRSRSALVDGVERRGQIAAEQQREERERQDQEGPAGAFGHLTQSAATALRRASKPPRP